MQRPGAWRLDGRTYTAFSTTVYNKPRPGGGRPRRKAAPLCRGFFISFLPLIGGLGFGVKVLGGDGQESTPDLFPYVSILLNGQILGQVEFGLAQGDKQHVESLLGLVAAGQVDEFPIADRVERVMPVHLHHHLKSDPLRHYERAVDIVEVDRKSTRLNSSHLGISYAV